MRQRLVVVGLVALLGPANAFGADEPPTSPAAAGESSEIKPAGERQLGARGRPTVKKRQDAAERKKRQGRLSLRIPERLRRTLEAKIERRIVRNVAEATRLRREAIRLLDRFLAESPESAPGVPEALMRLGELEWEDARDRFLADFKRWERQPVDVRGEPPTPDYAKARGRFLRVLQRHKRFRDYDLALYVDGFLANEQGKFDDALGRFDTILAWFPRSRFVPDAHMVRAEYEFTKDFPDYEIAYLEYEKVLSFEGTGLYDIALFKSAWCLWRLGRTDEAARRFLSVFQRTYDAAEAAERAGKSRADIDELQREALRNLVAVFVEDEKHTAEDMHRFLVRAGGDKFAGKIVRALADAFYEQAHYERGIEAYRLLLKLEPLAADGWKHALAVAQGHSTMERWAELEADYRWITGDFTAPPPAPKGKRPRKASAWAQAQGPATLAEAERAIEAQLREDAVGLHAKAQRDQNSKVEFQAAAALYGVYLERFGKQAGSYEIWFNAGEIWFHRLDDAVRAADAYLAAVRLQPKGAYSRDALLNALAALEQARSREFEAAKAAGRRPEETATDRKLTEAMELYVGTFPDDPKVPELLFRQGKLYYDYGVYDPAVRQWGLLVEKYPRSSFAEGAGELILDSFNKSSDYANIETWARRLKKAPAFQSAEKQARLDKLIVQAVFKQGEQLAEQGKHALAAAAYLRAAREFPKEARAAQAAVNAEVEARRAADLGTLEEAAQLLLRDHAARPEAAQGLWIAASTYQSVGLFGDAARHHAAIAERFPKFEHHKDAAYNAVLLRVTIGDHGPAIESGERFRKAYPKDDLADEVTFLMGKAHEKAQKWKEAEALYANYARSARGASSQVEAWVRLAVVRLKLGDAKGAASALDSAVKLARLRKSQLDATGKYFAARARYMQGERILAEYEAIEIAGDVKQLKERLRRKSELLKKAAETFLDTAEWAVAEWTTAALYQIGFTYESFAKALLASAPPPELAAEEKELFKQQIEEFVIPIEERALEAYESGWQKAVELGIFNGWTAKMRVALGRLNSELYVPLREFGLELRSRGPSPLPPLIDGPRRGKDGRSERYYVPLSPAKEAPGAKSPGGEPAAGKASPGKEPSAKPAQEAPR
ncbi:MAG: tetratricopeptide repeat protein [Polyangiaceae bacterium]|nr:tetratricopeptide repeat protein [Polyangiaceae bacterium]